MKKKSSMVSKMALFPCACKPQILCPKPKYPCVIFLPSPSNIPTTIKFEVSKLSISEKLANAVVRKVKCRSCSSASSEVEKEAHSSPIIFIKVIFSDPISKYCGVEQIHVSVAMGLAQSTTEGPLKEVFSQFGEVGLVKIINDKKTKQSLGFAYVWFTQEEDAQTAVDEMNGKFLEGRFIYVTIARPGSCKSRPYPIPYKF